MEACLTLGPDHRSSCMMTMMSRCIKGDRCYWQTSSALPGSVCCSKTQQSGSDPRAPCTMPWHLCKKAVCTGASNNDGAVCVVNGISVLDVCPVMVVLHKLTPHATVLAILLAVSPPGIGLASQQMLDLLTLPPTIYVKLVCYIFIRTYI